MVGVGRREGLYDFSRVGSRSKPQLLFLGRARRLVVAIGWVSILND